MTSKALQVSVINQEITKQLADKETAQALMTTTFKGLSLPVMKQAILEGMMRGFTFQNFLEKDVYALPFSGGYSLVTSIDYMRKVAMRTGTYAGKSEPVWSEDGATCTITVKRLVEGLVCDFTATVYLSEYSTGKNQWLTRPKTMLSKVAEMHALRMAFPEELSKAYVEEEMSVKAEIVEPIDYIAIQTLVDACKSVDDLKQTFVNLSKVQRGDADVVKMFATKKVMLTTEEEIPVV